MARAAGSFVAAVISAMKNYFARRKNSGATLVEVLLVIAISLILGAAIFSFQSDVFSLNRLLQGLLTGQQEARQVFKQLNWETRSMSPSSTGAYSLAEAATSSLIFYTDTNSDGLKERLRYFLVGETLKRGMIVPAGHPLTYNPNDEIIDEIVHHVANGAAPVFEYYDKDYDGTTAPLAAPIDLLAVRLVKMTLLIDADLTRPPDPLILTSQMSIRNLKDNL